MRLSVAGRAVSLWNAVRAQMQINGKTHDTLRFLVPLGPWTCPHWKAQEPVWLISIIGHDLLRGRDL